MRKEKITWYPVILTRYLTYRRVQTAESWKRLLVRLFSFMQMTVNLRKLRRFRLRFGIVHFAAVIGEQPIVSEANERKIVRIIAPVSLVTNGKVTILSLSLYAPGVSLFLSFFLIAILFLFFLFPSSRHIPQGYLYATTLSLCREIAADPANLWS